MPSFNMIWVKEERYVRYLKIYRIGKLSCDGVKYTSYVCVFEKKEEKVKVNLHIQVKSRGGAMGTFFFQIYVRLIIFYIKVKIILRYSLNHSAYPLEPTSSRIMINVFIESEIYMIMFMIQVIDMMCVYVHMCTFEYNFI